MHLMYTTRPTVHHTPHCKTHARTGILAEDAVTSASLPELVPRLSSIPKPWLALGAAVLAKAGGGVPEQFTPLAFIDNPDLDTQVGVGRCCVVLVLLIQASCCRCSSASAVCSPLLRLCVLYFTCR